MRLLSTATKILTISLLFGVISITARGQSFDYEKRPIFDYKFTEATIDLEINPEEGSVRGSVMYSLQANISSADSLELDAAGIEVDSVLSQGQSLDYTAQNERLLIALADSGQAGDQYQVEIFYHTTPDFGLLKSSNGTVWTSMLPRSTRHWLPVKDHPRVQLTATLSVQVPATYRVFASGVKTDEQVLSTDRKKVTFRTSRPVPVTSLAFGFGQLREEGTSLGIKRINSYAEANSISSPRQANLVQRTRQIIGEIEQVTGRQYPYQGLHIVILNDHYWEQKSYGASAIFLYKNRGDLVNQLRRGLYGQWFGVYRYEEQWAASWPVHYLQSALHHQLSDSAAMLATGTAEPETGFTTVYDAFSAKQWNDWQQYSSQNMQQVGNQLVPAVLQQASGVISPESFNELWYQATGQPSVQVPQFKTEDISGASTTARDSVKYRVDYNLNQPSGALSLTFTAQQGSMMGPVTLPVEIIAGGSANSAEVTFSGSTDSVSVAIPAGTQTVMLKVPEGTRLSLEEHKPVPYLLYQLRNGETLEARKEAAIQMGFHTDNPDLQLALNDLMQRDMEPEVEAALLQSYGKITTGADGTQQRFLEALESPNKAKRAVALNVLDNYKSQEITSRLRTYSENESDDQLSNRALKMYMQRIDSSAALQFTNTLVQQDTAGTKAIVAIDALGAKGNAQQAVKLANFYIEPVFDYAVRKQALAILLANDTSAESWKKRVAMLMNDADPRIRFLAVRSLSEMPGVEPGAIIQTHITHAYDARVIEALNNKK